MGDDIGARVRSVDGLPDVLADLIGAGFTFSTVEDYDKAMEWALRAYRAGQAATPDRHDTADFWFKVAVNTAKRAGLPCPRCMHPTKSHRTDNEESRPGCHRGECLCSWTPQELLIAYEYEYEYEAATPDGPRRWALPDEPGPEVTAVRGGSQTIYRRVGPHWQDGAHRVVESWWEILADGPLTDATPAADGQDGDGRG